MTKNPIFLVALAVAAGLATLALILFLAPPAEEAAKATPIVPKPGEAIRLQPAPPTPPLAKPEEVARSLEGAAMLPGDRPIADALNAALAAGERPSYKVSIDVPVADNAAQAIKDEVRSWVGRKMAGMGFEEAQGKPSLSWVLHVDPADGGKYEVKALLRAGGETRFEQAFVVPNEYAADRMDRSFGQAFAPAAKEVRP